MTRPLDDLLRDLGRRMDDDAPAVLVPNSIRYFTRPASSLMAKA
jgi:hypothetical protein